MRLVPGVLCLLINLRTPALQRFEGRVVEVAGALQSNEAGEGLPVSAPWLLEEFGLETVWAATCCLLPISPPRRLTGERTRITA